MLDVEKGEASPADVGDDRLAIERTEEEGRTSVDDDEEPSSGVECEDDSSDESGDESEDDSDEEEVAKSAKVKKRKKHSKKKKKKKQKDETQKKSKKKDKKENKKKKGDSKKQLAGNETWEQDNGDNSGSNENEEDTDQGSKTQKGERAMSTASRSPGTPTPSCTSSLTDESSRNKFMMTSLRRNEKARARRESDKTYDSDDDGLWVGTGEDKSRTSESKDSSSDQKKKKTRKRRDKAEWESSVAAENSYIPHGSDDSEEDIAPCSYRSTARRRSSRDISARSHRSMSARSHRSMSGTSFRSSSGKGDSLSFRSMKEDRNSSLKRSINLEDLEVSDTSEKSSRKPISRAELRKDLEAQARQRVESNSNEQRKGEILAVLRECTSKSMSKLKSVLELTERGTERNQDELESSDDEKDDNMEGTEGKTKTKKKDNGDKKLDRRQKWVAFKEKARSRKGYIVLISIFVSLFVIANVVLIVYLTK